MMKAGAPEKRKWKAPRQYPLRHPPTMPEMVDPNQPEQKPDALMENVNRSQQRQQLPQTPHNTKTKHEQ